MVKSRTVSAPYCSIKASGSTVLPLDLDILAPSLSTMPWVRSRVKGSSCPRSPASRMSRWKKRA